MKSIKFLAALAIPAMFAACTSEALVDNTPQKMNEVVGAELVGSGISMNATIDNSVATRITANGKFESTDKLGLGWIVNDLGTTGAQKYEDVLTDNKLYANDLFQWNDEAGAFATTANIYKGWHFAYFPYAYMETVGGLKVSFEKPQTSQDWKDMVNDYFYISSRKFLTKDSLDEKTLQLASPFNMVNVYNTLYVLVKPADTLKAGKFKELAVKSITLNHNDGVNGEGPFTTQAILNVSKLPLYVHGNYKADSTNIANALIGGKVLSFVDLKDTITTDVEKAGYKVADNMTLRMILNAPVAGTTLDAEELSFDINVAGGAFHVGYVAGAAAGSTDEFNNKELIALAKTYETNGAMTGSGAEYTLRLKLEGKHFTPAPVVISNLPEWEDAVATAEALGRTDVVFEIDDTITFENEIPMPENCNVTVKSVATPDTTGLQITGTMSNWPAKLTSNVAAIIAEGATWNVTETLKPGSVLENYGTINVTGAETVLGKYASYALVNKGIVNLAAKTTADAVYNYNRVNIVYGAKITNLNVAGIVAYSITGEAVEAKNIDQMITYAELNTLVVGAGKTLDLNLTWTSAATEGDEYEGGTPGTPYTMADLSAVNIELYSGSVVGDITKKYSVKNVSALSGTCGLTDVIPGAEVKVAADVEFNIQGTGDLDWSATTMVNAGNTNVNQNVKVNTWSNTGWLKMATGKNIEAVTTPSIKGNMMYN